MLVIAKAIVNANKIDVLTKKSKFWILAKHGKTPDPPECGITFLYTGTPQYWTVPTDVHYAYVKGYGASGGESGGEGDFIQFRMPVVPGVTYQVNVGGNPLAWGTAYNHATGGWPDGGNGSIASGFLGWGGGGGGSTDMRLGSFALTDKIFSAAGGGGGSESGWVGGKGGYPFGDPSQPGTFSTAAGGGTQTSGGAGGIPSPVTGLVGNPGVFGQGGSAPGGGFFRQAGGGGGGYYGGGSGTSDFGTDDCGGGGGSSYFNPAYGTLEVNGMGGNTGHGFVRIDWECPGGTSIPSVPPTADFEWLFNGSLAGTNGAGTFPTPDGLVYAPPLRGDGLGRALQFASTGGPGSVTTTATYPAGTTPGFAAVLILPAGPTSTDIQATFSNSSNLINIQRFGNTVTFRTTDFSSVVIFSTSFTVGGTVVVGLWHDLIANRVDTNINGVWTSGPLALPNTAIPGGTVQLRVDHVFLTTFGTFDDLGVWVGPHSRGTVDGYINALL